MGELPSAHKQMLMLSSHWLETPLGSMIAISDNEKLYLLEFVDRRGLENEIKQLRKKLNVSIIPSNTIIIEQLQKELQEYFEGNQWNFTVPIGMIGSDFQKGVWKELIQIPLGETQSYKQLAETVGNERAARAVANANGKNQVSILVPCHRIINSDGSLGGYGGGIERKKWLIHHEKQMNLMH